jgi:two-component sensor histidine kinase/ABC-type amino acid transport substrate-binding protein
MKWAIVTMFILVLFFSLSGIELRVGVYENSPKVFLNESNQPDGIFIDIINDIADKENWELSYHYDTWGNCLDLLEKGDIDLMTDVSFSKERLKRFAYHEEPVLSDWFHVYASMESGINSILDLEGKKIIVLEDSIQEAIFRDLIYEFNLNIELFTMPDYANAFSDVKEKNADAVITNRYFGVKHYKQYGLQETGIVFNPTRLHYAASKSLDKNILRKIDEHLIVMKNDPNSIYYESLKKWTSEEGRFSIPPKMKFLFFLITFMLLFTFLGMFLLKKQVLARTKQIRAINEEIQKSLDEKTVLLKEIHHRVKNNLQVISSMINLQRKTMACDTDKNIMLDIRNRIKAIALVHEKVYQTQKLVSIDANSFINEMVKHLSHTYLINNRDIKFHTEIESVFLSVDEAVPCALIINELITNSLKYAFEDRNEGNITIHFSQLDNQYFLDIFDDGIGFQKELNLKNPDSIGLKIVTGLVQQLNGTIEIKIENGTKFEIRFS